MIAFYWVVAMACCGSDSDQDVKAHQYINAMEMRRDDELKEQQRVLRTLRNPSPGSLFFPSRKKLLDDCEKRISALKRGSLPKPGVIDEGKVGSIGTLSEASEVLQVVGGGTVLLSIDHTLSGVSPDLTTETWRSERVVMLKKCTTPNLTEDSPVPDEMLTQIWEVVGTTTYSTPVMTSKTVSVLEPFDLEVVYRYIAKRAAGEMRTWNDTSGKYSVDAKASDLTAATVRLERPDGTSVTVQINKLSEPDRQYISDLKRWRNRMTR